MTDDTSTRRAFLRRGLTVAAAPALFAASPQDAAHRIDHARRSNGDRILVVVHLAGGNDGLNTVVPFADDGYHRARPDLRVDAAAVHRLDDTVGLHPNLGPLLDLYRRGRVAIIQGVGYPACDRSHSRAADVWHSADPAGEAPVGWLGRYLDRTSSGAETRAAAYSGGVTPLALRAARVTPRALAHGGGCFAGALREAAAMIAGGLPTRVYFLQLGGFDTHVNQRGRHDRLMKTFADAVAGFWAELEARRSNGRVLMLAFSEFGRSVAQNSSGGTDHGAAGPVFLLGPRVRGGVVGGHPSLRDLEDGGVRHLVDFRSVYATVLDSWLGAPGDAVLGRRFTPLPLIIA